MMFSTKSDNVPRRTRHILRNLNPLTKGYSREPSNHIKRPTIDPPAKRHLNGVSLAGRLAPEIVCLLGKSKSKYINHVS